MSELVMIEQRRAPGGSGASLWVREGDRRLPGQDSDARLTALRAGLARHAGVRALDADAADATVERTLGSLHERRYLDALGDLRSEDPVVMPEFAPPGLEPDIPVNAGLVAAAREGVRTSISAAQRTLAGAEFTYAVCRPPGHHAGPAFHAGYCYLNNAAAAVRTLLDGGLGPVGVLDLDLHYPNGTAALLERMPDRADGGAILHSLHASPVTNLPPGAAPPRPDGGRALAFAAAPDAATYVAEVAASVAALAAGAAALVVSLGYDTLRGDPHGAWAFEPEVFARIGSLLAAAGRPICVVQEGGYALEELAACAHAFVSGLLGEDPGMSSAEGLQPFRDRLDVIDDELARLLGERFQICREVAVYKSRHEIPMMQPNRVEIVRRYLERGAEVELPAEFTASLFDLLIAATCRAEDELMDQLERERSDQGRRAA